MINSKGMIRILIALILLSIVLTACQNTDIAAEKQLEKQLDKQLDKQLEKEHYTTEHFTYILIGDQSAPSETLMNELESEYARITELLNVTSNRKFEITIFANRGDFLEQTGYPTWSGGGYSRNGMFLPPDYNPKVAVHELTHILINRVNPNTPRWLNEGIATYIAEDLPSPLMEIENSVVLDMIPPSSSYYIVDPNEFMNIKGYPFSYSMIDFIVSEYGWDQLRQLIRSPYDFEGAFQLSLEEFWNNWKEYLEKQFTEES